MGVKKKSFQKVENIHIETVARDLKDLISRYFCYLYNDYCWRDENIRFKDGMDRAIQILEEAKKFILAFFPEALIKGGFCGYFYTSGGPTAVNGWGDCSYDVIKIKRALHMIDDAIVEIKCGYVHIGEGDFYDKTSLEYRLSSSLDPQGLRFSLF